jgi:dihydrofolate reductase
MKAIAAMARNRVIGCKGRIPWHLPADFKWFKQCTTGQAVLMGRKTYESLGKPLPNRRNLVVTRGPAPPGMEAISELASFDPERYAPREVWVIGGAEIYRQMLGRCSDLYLSIVNREVEGDATFPEFESGFEDRGVVLQEPEFEVRHYRNRRV